MTNRSSYWILTAKTLDESTVAVAKPKPDRKLSEKERFVRALMAAGEGEA